MRNKQISCINYRGSHCRPEDELQKMNVKKRNLKSPKSSDSDQWETIKDRFTRSEHMKKNELISQVQFMMGKKNIHADQCQ